MKATAGFLWGADGHGASDGPHLRLGGEGDSVTSPALLLSCGQRHHRHTHPQEAHADEALARDHCLQAAPDLKI
jgi:hypothetical protein